MPKAAVISLGCPRNLVDSEVVSGSLKELGYTISSDPAKGADLCVINTCAFISSAREESVDAILEAASLKKSGRIKKIVVCGCLPQMYDSDLIDEMPEIDLMLGTSDIPRIKYFLNMLRSGRAFCRSNVSGKLDYIYSDSSPRSVMTPRHYAYVKIAEGCSNVCSYCVIPKLRGSFRSRGIGSVVKEVKDISGDGSLKEVMLIGQDTTLFGKDRHGRSELAKLIKRLDGLDTSVEWFRLLYTHPAHYNEEMISAMRASSRFCRYLDLPIQHASDRILKAMNRRVTKKDISSLIDRLRIAMPEISLRTSIIVGFPGETDREFREVLDFVRQVRFERLGAFKYSKEDGTKAASMKGQVPEKIKKERLDELMRLQKKISASILSGRIGKTLKVLIDEKEGGVFVGRTEYDAPEIDGCVYVSGKGIKAGRFCDVRITGSMEYDLIGKAVQ